MAGYLGNIPSAVPLTSADIADGIITSAKIVDGTIVNADINASSAIAISKISATGTANQVLRMNSGATALEFATVSGTTFGSALLHVRDEKASGTHGGTTTTSYTARDLNTVVTNEISGASLASNQITLPSGTYFIYASAPSYASNRHTAKLRNTTDSTDTILGTSEYSDSATSVQTRSFVIGRFTISAQKVFEIQHRVQTANATLGLGVAKDMSETNIYTNLQIWKVA
jgi:hypothetical protein